MGWFHVIAIGVILGLAAGSMAERVLVTALVQSVAAFLVALVVGNVSTLVWWTRGQAGSGYFGLGVENLLYLAILCIGAAALHVGLGRLGDVWFPFLSGHRAVILGCAGGLWGTLSSASAIKALSRGTM